MYRVLAVVLFLIGLVQFAAMLTGFQNALGFFGVVLALILGEIPIVGTIFGILGAVNGWGWGILPALGLFFGVPGATLLIAVLTSRREQ
jgi:hypothetical protein